MCGICGALNSDSSKIIDKSILVGMNESLFHRGPDDEGYFIQGNVGLGMRRLSIIDVKGGHQPIYNENKTICVVCNGEIYNYLELRGELESKGHKFSTNSDVEAIVHLYEDYGEDLVQELRGMFAFALYDLSGKKLILCRDRLGIKPLYYTFQKGILLFASELKAILRYPGIDKKISYEALSDYLTYLYIPASETIYENIYKLPPAHLLIFKDKDFTLRQYWELDYRKTKEEPEEYYVERLRKLLKESVKMHLMSEVPLGAFLSGGMDSSAIIALMSEVSSAPIKTFSVGFDASGFNELGYAKLVASSFDTQHHEINLKPDIIKLLPKVAVQFDEPFADSSAIPTYLISEFAKQKVTVCLAGDGGDELFAGYGWTRRQKFIDDYNSMPKAFRNIIRKVILSQGYEPDRSSALPDKIRRFIIDANMPLESSILRRITCFSDVMKRELFKEDILLRLNGYQSRSVISTYLSKKDKSNMEKLLYLDSKLFLPDDGLCKVDRMSMMHSLEVRVPFLDHKVVEFVAAIPFKYKMHGRNSKYILKKIMKGKLPSQILRQRKLGFTIPLNSWFRGQLRNFVKESLLPEEAKLGSLFNKSYIKNMIEQHFGGRQDFGPQIYALLVLEIWLRENKYEGITN